jgi:NTP pyrophosphatase (non-canonical NTP hydrolase)
MYEAFDYLTRVSVERSREWHKDEKDVWDLMQWACAMCGEAGETANVAKKIWRHEHGMKNGTASELSRVELRQQLGEEIADTFLYLVLLAYEGGIDFYGAVARKFNKTSEQNGFDQRLVSYPDTIQKDD